LNDVLGLQPADIVVTIRPPATEAQLPQSREREIAGGSVPAVGANPGRRWFCCPRTPKQEAELRQANRELFAAGRIIVPKHAVDGLDLIWYSDVVISGGGTMNREAAALGIPVYSLFRGTMGAVDKIWRRQAGWCCSRASRDVREKLSLVSRDKNFVSRAKQSETLDAVVNHIVAILENNS